MAETVRVETTVAVASGGLLQFQLTPTSDTDFHVVVADISALPNPNENPVGRNVVLLIDVSGSMSPALASVRQTVCQLANALTNDDSIAIIAFESEARVVLDFSPAAQVRPQIAAHAAALVAGGSTNLLAGTNAVMEVIERGAVQAHGAATGAPPDPRVTLVLILSDGEPTDSIQPDKRVNLMKEQLYMLAVKHKTQTMVSCFGYGRHAAANVLQSLVTAGSFACGMYYSLQTEIDIAIATGDCLGGLNQIAVLDLALTAEAIDAATQLPLVPAIPCYAFGKDLRVVEDMQGTESVDSKANQIGVPILTAQQLHTAVFLVPSSAIAACPNVALRLTCNYTRNNERRSLVRTCPLAQAVPEPTQAMAVDQGERPALVPLSSIRGWIGDEDGEVFPLLSPRDLHALVHIVRVQASLTIQRASLGLADKESLLLFHQFLLQVLGQIQSLGDQDYSLRDEGVVESLQQDIAELLIALDMPGNLSNAGRFLQLAHEHIQQRSASASRTRIYSTQEQMSMRLKFLAGGQGGGGAVRKTEVPLLEPNLTPDQILLRKKAEEDLVCYITLESWRTTQLGLGILVRPRNLREIKRKLMPGLELVHDYLSAAAFNSGVRTLAKALPNINRDDEDLEESHSVVKSTARGRINAWLPLYINHAHWSQVSGLAPSAFSLIATQTNDLFQPSHALKVCSKLMIQTIVKFTEEEKVSEKALQMYCDVHRLFVQMSREYPSILAEAETKLRTFIDSPPERDRQRTPDLGDLLEYLSITDKVSWEEFGAPFIVEALRRNALQITLHYAKLEIHTIEGDVDGLLKAWFELTSGGRVTLFNVLFLRLVARPIGKSVDDVAADYDAQWGRLSAQQVDLMKGAHATLRGLTSFEQVMAHLGFHMSNEALAELILFAFENINEGSHFRGNYLLPQAGGPLLARWRERVQLYQLALALPPREVDFAPPAAKRRAVQRKTAHLSATLAQAAQRMDINSDDDSAYHVDVQCQCKRCSNEVERRRKVQRWQPHLHDSKRTLFIGRLSYATTSQSLQQAISLLHPGIQVETAVVVVDTVTGKSRGYGFVTLAHEDHLQLALRATSLPFGLVDERKFASDLKESKHTIAIDGRAAVIDRVFAVEPEFFPRYLGGGVGPGRKGPKTPKGS